MENLHKEKSKLIKVAFVLVVLLSAYVATKIITEIKGYRFIGGGAPASNVISFDGKGEVSAKPDLATISFTIRESQNEVKVAQDKVTAKETAMLNFLTTSGVDKKDIKTENYSSYPTYEYVNSICPTYSNMRAMGGSEPAYYCPPGKQNLTGYEVSENVSVKVRDLAKAGDIVKGLGVVGITEISGPNFSVENEDELKAQARKMAIDEAKAKAKVLSHDLGVNLVRIVNFSENGNYPLMYELKGGMARDSAVAAPATPSPELPTGENKITSNVTITYEIR